MVRCSRKRCQDKYFSTYWHLFFLVLWWLIVTRRQKIPTIYLWQSWIKIHQVLQKPKSNYLSVETEQSIERASEFWKPKFSSEPRESRACLNLISIPYSWDQASLTATIFRVSRASFEQNFARSQH